jgi:predicted nucleic acid-binding protein
LGALTVYLDTSVAVPLLLPDAFADRALRFLAGISADLIVSDFVATEFASVVGIRLRSKLLSAADARTVLTNLDVWIARSAQRVELDPLDIRSAEAMLRRLDLVLRAPDAINIAVAQRMGADLATFDRRMADNAGKLGIRLAKV